MWTRSCAARSPAGLEPSRQPGRHPDRDADAPLTPSRRRNDEHAHLGGARGAAPLAALFRPPGLLHRLRKRTAGVIHGIQPRGGQPAATRQPGELRSRRVAGGWRRGGVAEEPAGAAGLAGVAGCRQQVDHTVRLPAPSPLRRRVPLFGCLGCLLSGQRTHLVSDFTAFPGGIPQTPFALLHSGPRHGPRSTLWSAEPGTCVDPGRQRHCSRWRWTA